MLMSPNELGDLSYGRLIGGVQATLPGIDLSDAAGKRSL
jgi:hypothetical protein